MFVARKSNHIQEDLERGWSSWNFGQEGFSGDRDELVAAFEAAIEEGSSIWISGFDVWPSCVSSAHGVVYADDFEFRELYAGYWVAVDNVNARGGLSCISLQATDLGMAIEEATSRTDYFGDGDSFNPEDYELVYSSGDTHIFCEK